MTPLVARLRRIVAAALVTTGAGMLAARGASAAPPAPKPAPKKGPSAVPASKAWHMVPPGKTAPLDASGRPMLVLQGLNIPDHVELSAATERGGFSAEDLDRAAHVMREPSSGNEHPIDPRLLDMIYRLEVHFKAPEIRIISGYRTPRPKSPTSNHGRGRAMDLVVPGSTDEEVAKFAREQGFAGVGVYPVSGFVHVDVREHSFFWVDSSGPGKRSRLRGILADLAQKSDAQATARGERSVGPFLLASDVDAAVGTKAVASTTPAAPDEDDEGDAPPAAAD
ncbi:MAG: YcbK family protein [Deltaproteobacteria bacterium]|nr:YcbK family protein [Deltaproteobacteria bacterium]